MDVIIVVSGGGTTFLPSLFVRSRGAAQILFMLKQIKPHFSRWFCLDFSFEIAVYKLTVQREQE